MKITVWGGSPKGKLSVTAEHVKIWEESLPGGTAEFTYEYPGARIARLEKDGEEFDRMMAGAAGADIILWAVPVYFMAVPAGFKRFIELINERGRQEILRNRTVGVLLTSIRYYDHTALNYLQAVGEDWGCRPGGALSLGMHDVFDKERRSQLFAFGKTLLERAERPRNPSRQFAPLPDRSEWVYEPDLTPSQEIPRNGAVLIHDGSLTGRMEGMAEKVRSLTGGQIKEYDLTELIGGNCLGCLKCGPENRCAYEGKDGFTGAFREWREADILIMAGTIRDRYLSSVWKSYFDRSFWRTHQPSFAGKKIIWLMSGPFSRLANLREVLLTYGEMQGATRTDFISDEEEGSALLDERIESALALAAHCSGTKEVPPVTFRRIGGFRIFRDEIFGGLKIIFRRDHRTYRKEGIYDFPQKRPLRLLFVNLGYAVTAIPFVKSRITSQMPRHMLMRYGQLRKGLAPPASCTLPEGSGDRRR